MEAALASSAWGCTFTAPPTALRQSADAPTWSRAITAPPVIIVVNLMATIFICIVIILCHVLLTRCLIILVDNTDLVTILTVIVVERVLPHRRTVVVFFSRDVDLLLALVVVVSPLPSPAELMAAGFGGEVRLPYK